MKKSILSSAILLSCLVSGGYVQAQQQTSASQGKTVPDARIAPEKSSTGQQKPVIIEKSNPATINSQEVYNNSRKALEASEKAQARNNKSFHPNDGSGVITMDVGIIKQGAPLRVYFPANFKTLESEETVMTPAVSRADFIKYQKLTEAKGITDVRITAREGKYNKAFFHGFDVIYNPDAVMGKVDEVVEVFTKKGNLQLRIIGYVVDKDTKLSMK